MKNVKVSSVGKESITFENGFTLISDHDQDCCESHYLDFEHLSIGDFEGLEFDLSGDLWFSRIPDYGIALNPINGHPVRIPGYGYNNGYYSSNLSLLVYNESGEIHKQYDITECQEDKGG